MISIISLLSSIVMTSLNSARNKAKNAAVTASMKSWLTALNRYYIDNGEYYVTSGATCMGVEECSYYQGVPQPNITVSPAFNLAMNPYIPGTPNPMPELARWNVSNEYRAFFENYSSTAFDGSITWFLYGATSCGFGAASYPPGQFGNNSKYTYCELLAI